MMRTTLLLASTFFFGQAFSQTLNTVESVEYDSANHRWLASNGSSVISVDGNGDEVDYFGSDPEADYGMEVMNDVLYTIVGSSVRGYALADGAQVFNVTVAAFTQRLDMLQGRSFRQHVLTAHPTRHHAVQLACHGFVHFVASMGQSTHA